MAIINYPVEEYGFFGAFMLEAAGNAETLNPAKFDWDGNTDIPCTCGPFRKFSELRLDGGGWDRRSSCKVRVKIPNLPDADDLPKQNDDITVYLSLNGPGRLMRIFATEISADVELEMECVESNHEE